MPVDPRGGHLGALYVCRIGQSMVKLTGIQDASYTRGQNFADAHGMDSPHAFKVPVKSDPSIKAKNIHDWAQTELMRLLALTETGVYGLFAFYPRGEFDEDENLDHGITGSAFFKVDTTQSLTDPITNDIELMPAQPDWTPFGDWDPA